MAIGTIGKYERLDVLGHGTSGVVYLAWDTLLRRQVALKEIRAPAPEMENILLEARVLDRLRHPNIVAVQSVDQQNGALLIDMELVRGQNLADVLRERNGAPLPAPEAGRIALAVLQALDYAHERRILHRDIKPANILVGREGTVKLTDFGLAEALGSGSVAGGGGTYPYMAPEDFAEEDSSDYRSDLWAVGVVLYEMLTGRRPFSVARPKDPFAWKRVIEGEEPPPPTAVRPELAPALDAVCRRALAKDKADRFPAAEEFAAALRDAIQTAREARGCPQRGCPQRGCPQEAGLFRFVSASGQGLATADTLDDLLVASLSHWDEARRALLDGRFERWLRGIGEVYIADLAAELAAREGDAADERLHEFLDRSGLDLALEARRCPAEEGAPSPCRLSAGAWGRRPGPCWWFWPLLALCLAPPAVFLGMHRDNGQSSLLLAWVASGFLSGMLLLVALGANLPALARAVCLAPLAGGLAAAGALTSGRLAGRAALDDLILAAGFAAMMLAVLLAEAATVRRLWRLWAFLVFCGALLAARFAPAFPLLGELVHRRNAL